MCDAAPPCLFELRARDGPILARGRAARRDSGAA